VEREAYHFLSVAEAEPDHDRAAAARVAGVQLPGLVVLGIARERTDEEERLEVAQLHLHYRSLRGTKVECGLGRIYVHADTLQQSAVLIAGHHRLGHACLLFAVPGQPACRQDRCRHRITPLAASVR
jgi:hypothetical protein